MQRSIASFFTRLDKSNKSTGEMSPSPTKPKKKRKALVISSDEDDEPQARTPKKAAHDKKKSRKEEPRSNDKSAKQKCSPQKQETKKLQPVDPAQLFDVDLKRVPQKKPPKPKDKALLELDNDDINQSLLECDMDVSIVEAAAKVEQPKEIRNKTPESDKKHKLKVERDSKAKEEQQQEHTTRKEPRKQEKLEKLEETHLNKTPAANKKKTERTPKPKKESADLESSVLSDEERHERRRMTAMLYQKYKNRASCLNPGSKEVPQGKPNCLAGLSFLVTGVLESLERDEAGSIIKEYGGKVMSTVGKRLNYLIVGEDAGPKKMVQAEELGIQILSEDGFLDLIRERSGDLKAKAKKEEATPDKRESKESSHKIKKEKSTPEEQYKSHKDDSFKAEKRKDKLKEENPTPEKKPKLHVEHAVEVSVKKEKQTPEKLDERNNNKSSKAPCAPMLTAEEKLAKLSEDNMLAWVDKYKPTHVRDIVGQMGAASNVTKLTNWLTKWYTNHDGKKKLQKPNPWAKNDDGSFYKAALLSGPPGIGKTTTATLVCKELGFDAVEFNASDTRSKRLLKEEVSELLSNKSLAGYFSGQGQAVSKKHVLIMDEVDGMAGNEDRGGMQELIALIKDSSVPIICMCNDRNHQKMRSLVTYCYDLRFNRPTAQQIKARMLSICAKEKFKLPTSKVEEVIEASNHDIRQSINHLALLSAGQELNLQLEAGNKPEERTAQKDLKLGPWEVVRKVFSADEHKRMNFHEKCELFFHDYSLAPLFVQQNYLQVAPAGPKKDVMRKVAASADALSLGDLVDKRIRSSNAWSLLPAQAVFSSVLPGEYMCGIFTGQINFPGWLGKNSRANKRCRLAQELHDHTRACTSASRLSIRLDYAPFLLQSIVRPLAESGTEGVPTALHVLKDYHLLREDIESLIELSTWPGKKSIMDGVDGRVKAALTRAYNKEVMAYSYTAQAAVKKKRAEAADETEMLSTESEEGAQANAADSDAEKEEDDNLENDALIKAKKKTSASAAKASTSKAAAGGKKTAGAAKSKPKAKK